MTYGVTADGYVAKPLEQIKSDVATRLRSKLGQGLNLTAESGLGQAYLIFCEELAQAWEAQAAEHKSWDPDNAEGEPQDNLCALTGTTRDDAEPSTVTVEVTTDQAVSYEAGQFVGSVDGDPTARFENAEAIVTAGADTVSVSFVAQDTGPVVANSGTLTEIETPLTGITGITNPLDAVLGAHIESSESLRVKREEELDAVGGGTRDSVRAALRQVDNVEAAEVFENKTDDTDGSGRPPHSLHAVLLGGTDADIAATLWLKGGGGINWYGSEVVATPDSEGKSQTVKFDRATELDVYITLDVDIIAADYPADGDDQLKAALIANGESERSMGDDVVAEALKSEVSPITQIAGVYDITSLKLGFSASPSGTTNLPVDETSIARYDTSRIVINTNPVSP